jgi:hypothetical protein
MAYISEHRRSVYVIGSLGLNLAQAGQTNALSIWNRVTRHLLHDCHITPKWRQNKKDLKSFETLKNIPKCHENTIRISAEKFCKNYLMICMYFLAILFQMQSVKKSPGITIRFYNSRVSG